MKPASAKSLINVKEAAKLLGVAPSFFYNHREVPSYRIGKALRFDADELREWFRHKAMLGR